MRRIINQTRATIGTTKAAVSPSFPIPTALAIGAVGATLILLLRKPLQRGLETGLNP